MNKDNYTILSYDDLIANYYGNVHHKTRRRKKNPLHGQYGHYTNHDHFGAQDHVSAYGKPSHHHKHEHHPRHDHEGHHHHHQHGEHGEGEHHHHHDHGDPERHHSHQHDGKPDQQPDGVVVSKSFDNGEILQQNAPGEGRQEYVVQASTGSCPEYVLQSSLPEYMLGSNLSQSAGMQNPAPINMPNIPQINLPSNLDLMDPMRSIAPGLSGSGGGGYDSGGYGGYGDAGYGDNSGYGGYSGGSGGYGGGYTGGYGPSNRYPSPGYGNSGYGNSGYGSGGQGYGPNGPGYEPTGPGYGSGYGPGGPGYSNRGYGNPGYGGYGNRNNGDPFAMSASDDQANAGDPSQPVSPDLFRNSTPTDGSTPFAQAASDQIPLAEIIPDSQKSKLSEDDLISDMQSILSGESVFDPVSKKTVPKNKMARQQSDADSGNTGPGGYGGGNGGSASYGNGYNQAGSAPDQAQSGGNNSHAIFDRIAQSMQFANAYDLGTVELENRFSDFDKSADASADKSSGKPGNGVPGNGRPSASYAASTDAETAGPAAGNADFLADLDLIRNMSQDTNAVDTPPQAATDTQIIDASIPSTNS